jgi:hypothetical protein
MIYLCFGINNAWAPNGARSIILTFAFLGQYRTKIVLKMRREIFRQIV